MGKYPIPMKTIVFAAIAFVMLPETKRTSLIAED